VDGWSRDTLAWQPKIKQSHVEEMETSMETELLQVLIAVAK